MTPDRHPVYALTPEDATDMARRRWGSEGLRIVRVLEVRRGCPEECPNQLHLHIVIAEVELDRKGAQS